jgi:hypothetical protein
MMDGQLPVDVAAVRTACASSDWLVGYQASLSRESTTAILFADVPFMAASHCAHVALVRRPRLTRVTLRGAGPFCISLLQGGG